jgi:hypothetical protein
MVGHSTRDALIGFTFDLALQFAEHRVHLPQVVGERVAVRDRDPRRPGAQFGNRRQVVRPELVHGQQPHPPLAERH